MNQKIEYMIEGKRLDGTFFGRRFFTDKKKAERYKTALEKKYPHLVILMLEV